MLERIESQGLSCFFDTENPRNVALYVKHGFEIVVDGQAAACAFGRFGKFLVGDGSVAGEKSLTPVRSLQ